MPDDFVRQVKDANPLAEVVAELVALSPMDGGLTGSCPFDPDHSDMIDVVAAASESARAAGQQPPQAWANAAPRWVSAFQVRPAHGGVFFCFGCGEHSDVIDFVAKTDNVDRYEAINRLARRAFGS